MKALVPWSGLLSLHFFFISRAIIVDTSSTRNRKRIPCLSFVRFDLLLIPCSFALSKFLPEICRHLTLPQKRARCRRFAFVFLILVHYYCYYYTTHISSFFSLIPDWWLLESSPPLQNCPSAGKSSLGSNPLPSSLSTILSLFLFFSLI